MLLKYLGRYSPIPLIELGIKVKTGEVFECVDDKLAANYLKKDVFEEATEDQLDAFEKAEDKKEKQESSENIEIASLKAKLTETESALKETKTKAKESEKKVKQLEKDLEIATKPLTGTPKVNGSARTNA